MISQEPQTVRLAFFGTSIMEHFEAYNGRMVTQSDLPFPGETVTVEGWRRRGYVRRLQVHLQLAHPSMRFTVDNRAVSGATSRDVLRIVNEYTATGTADVAFLGCGINDVWRAFEGRSAQAVPLKEFGMNYIRMISALRRCARHVVCIAETPFGWHESSDVTAMNDELDRYNHLAQRAATAQGAEFADIWTVFRHTACQLTAPGTPSPATPALWSDGVHLSELGDALLASLVADHLSLQQIIQSLTPSHAR